MRPEYPNFDKPVCSECMSDCKLILVDFGIGPTEFWGSYSNHTDEAWVSDCHEAEVIEGTNLELE